MTKQQYKLCAPCLFGLESVLSGEIKRLGFEDITVTDGRVEFTADAEGIARANLNLRTTERGSPVRCSTSLMVMPFLLPRAIPAPSSQA